MRPGEHERNRMRSDLAVRMRRCISIAAIALLAGCASPAERPTASFITETMLVTASSQDIRAVERDLRQLLADPKNTANAGISINEPIDVPQASLGADKGLINAAVDDARRRARVLGATLRVRVGEPPLAIDEVDPLSGAIRNGRSSKNAPSSLSSREIVRVTFPSFAPRRRVPPITVYGQATRPAPPLMLAPTQLRLQIEAQGDDAVKTIAAWETRVYDATRRHRLHDSTVQIGNVAMKMTPSPH